MLTVHLGMLLHLGLQTADIAQHCTDLPCYVLQISLNTSALQLVLTVTLCQDISGKQRYKYTVYINKHILKGKFSIPVSVSLMLHPSIHYK